MRTLDLLTLDWAGLALSREEERYFFAHPVSQRKDILPENADQWPTIYIPKDCPCFSRQLLYVHTKTNSVQTVMGLAALISGREDRGFVYDLIDQQVYDLSQVLFARGLRGVVLQMMVTAKKLVCSVLFMGVMNVAAYVLYEAVAIGFAMRRRSFHRAALRVLYFALVRTPAL